MRGVALYVMLTVAGVLYGIPAAAQLNESDTATFQFRAGATGAVQKGNVDLLVLRARLEFVSNCKRSLVFKSQNNSLYQQFSGFKADNDINSRNYFYHQPFRSVYPFAMIYLQTNYRKQVDFRWFGGAGATWQFVQKPATNMKVSASIVYEETDFRSQQFNEGFYDGSSTIRLWRATAYLAGWHRLLDNRLKLFYTAYWQPGWDEVTNNRAQLDVGLDFPVWKGLNSSLQYSFYYEQIVVTSVKQHDRILTFGVSYQFKK
ncbi:MAG: DUF481 domain-containing protein [Cyclobacteriaceae bacterium]|nr:DUF481 domain-containing protein [Cyclobacteriaceae bacterium]